MGDENKKSNSTKRCVIKQKIKILKIALKQINLKMKQINKVHVYSLREKLQNFKNQANNKVTETI